jgi:bacterioferritin (cytochrome b1)
VVSSVEEAEEPTVQISLQPQLKLIDKLGEALYSAQRIARPSTT